MKIVQGTTQGEHGENDILLYCTDGGISELHYDEVNEEMTGTDLNGTGLCITQFHGMGLSDESKQKVIGGAQDNSNYIFQDNQWENYDGNDRYDAVFYPTGKGAIPDQFERASIYQNYTESAGATGGSLNLDNGYFNAPIAGDPHELDIFYGGGDQFRACTYESSISTIQYENFSLHLSEDFGGKIRTVTISPIDNDYKFMAYGNPTSAVSDRLWYTTEEVDFTPYDSESYPTGALLEWTDLTFLLDGIINWKGIRYIACDPLEKNVIWLGMEDFNNVGVTSNRVLKLTIDENNISNSTVEDFSNGLPNTPVNILRFEPGKHRELWCGNDIGVYKLDLDDPQGPTWYCKSEEMPVVFVSDIEFDAHNHEVYISTFGRGVWKADLPCEKLDDYVLQEDETWPHVHMAIHSDVIVPDDVTLTITGTVGFGEHCGIIVEPGGELVVDGGHLTSACGDELWTGVQVIGQDDLQQTVSNQGWVFLDSAKIENAHTGISLRENDDQCNYVEGSGGGVVRANNSTFLNCYVGIQFAPYIYWASGNPVTNESQINNCDFLTTRILNGGFHPLTGLYLEDNFRVPVRGCRFNNLAADTASEYHDNFYNYPNNRGFGIKSWNTAFSIRDFCTEYHPTNGDCLGDIVSNEFHNLAIGVYATGYDLLSPFEVKNTLFKGNVVGIRTEGLQVGPSIVNNTFEMLEVEGFGKPGVTYDEIVGIDVERVTGFEIEENKCFGDDDNSDQPFVGVAFTNTGLNSNELYRNKFDNLTFATFVQRNNGGTLENDIDVGLQIKCNDFGQDNSLEINTRDVHLNEPYPTNPSGILIDSSINPEQGSYDAEIGPAANQFSYNCNNFISDLFVDTLNSVQGSSFLYIYPQGIATEPSCFSEDYVQLGDVTESYDESVMCPSNYSQVNFENGLTQLSGYTENMDIVEVTHDMYRDSIDRGDTQGLVNFINNAANSSIQVRNEMIACVPYISDSAWTAAFDRNPALNEWHLSQVLLQASPLDKGVIKMMNESNLDPYYRELVEDGQNGGMTHKMLLENDMANYRLEADKIKHDFLRQRMLWDTSGVAIDSLEYFYNSVAAKDDKVMKAAIHNFKGEYTMALSRLGNCIENGVTDDLCLVQKIIAESKKNGQFCPALTTKQENDLFAIAEDETSPANAMARAALDQYADSTWNVDILIPNLQNRSMPWEEEDDRNTRKGLVAVHPNPASGEAFFTTKIPEGVTSAEIILADSFGRVVWTTQVEGNQIIPLNLSRFGSGVYVYILKMDGVVTESGKLVITK